VTETQPSSAVSALSDVGKRTSIEAVQAALHVGGYVAERPLATSIFLALRLQRPLLLEGEAGVGKTEVAKVMAASLGTRLIRLQCYEGLDVGAAVYEWNYPRQMLEIRLLEARGEAGTARAADIFTEQFLIKRPLLQALERRDGESPVLLIDEVDRADEEFEAYLLELLAEYQVTIPELGPIRAAQPPRVILTSNRTREVHDALKRRCLYHWIDYPSFDKELEIVRTRLPHIDATLAQQVVAAIQRLRSLDLVKVPGIAETLDWASALIALEADELTPEYAADTLGVIVKYEEDLRHVKGQVEVLTDEARAARDG
jgi:MoxR-like ATPase